MRVKTKSHELIIYKGDYNSKYKFHKGEVKWGVYINFSEKIEEHRNMKEHSKLYIYYNPMKSVTNACTIICRDD